MIKLGSNNKPMEVFIIEYPMMGAFICKFLATRFIFLSSELAESMLQEKEQLEMIMGHEIGHLKAEHFRWQWLIGIWRVIPIVYNFYGRNCELTADRLGLIASGNIEHSLMALTKIMIGDKLSSQTNIDNLLKQAEMVKKSLAGKLGQLFSTHPYMVKRIKELIEFKEKNQTVFYGLQ